MYRRREGLPSISGGVRGPVASPGDQEQGRLNWLHHAIFGRGSRHLRLPSSNMTRPSTLGSRIVGSRWQFSIACNTRSSLEQPRSSLQSDIERAKFLDWNSEGFRSDSSLHCLCSLQDLTDRRQFSVYDLVCRLVSQIDHPSWTTCPLDQLPTETTEITSDSF